MAIRCGECEAAIVGGANLCLRPGTALQFYKLNMLSDDGVCKSFDASGMTFPDIIYIKSYKLFLSC